jgi:hypothetical protein
MKYPAMAVNLLTEQKYLEVWLMRLQFEVVVVYCSRSVCNLVPRPVLSARKEKQASCLQLLGN